MSTPAIFDAMGHETPAGDLAALTMLARTTAAVPGPVAVEVGTWAGRTALAILAGLPAGGRLYCVDHWRGNPCDRLGALAERIGAEAAFATFCRNMGGDLFTRVFPCSGTSLRWAAVWPGHLPIDLLFVDADHRYEHVLSDLDAWLPHVRPGGSAAVHDHGAFEGVDRAVAGRMPGSRIMGDTLACWVKP